MIALLEFNMIKYDTIFKEIRVSFPAMKIRGEEKCVSIKSEPGHECFGLFIQESFEKTVGWGN